MDMSSSKDFIKAMVSLENKFKSGNSIPVERSVITAEEFYAIYLEVQRLIINEEKALIDNLNLRERVEELEAYVETLESHVLTGGV